AARGYVVALHYNRSFAAAQEALADFTARGVQADTVGADLTDEAAVQRLVEEVLARFGQVDVLVNCAAIWERKRLEAVTASDVRGHFEANVLSTFLCARAVGLVMVQQPQGGCIVNLGDWADIRPYKDYAAYFATKGSIPALTRCLAVELGSRNPCV